jgi:hypothetical protein
MPDGDCDQITTTMPAYPAAAGRLFARLCLLLAEPKSWVHLKTAPARGPVKRG